MHGDPPLRAPRAARPDRARGRRQLASRRRLRRVRVHHGFPQDAGAFLEEGRNAGGRALGRGERFGRQSRRSLEMTAMAFVAVGVGAALGAWLRWILSVWLN